MDFWAVTLLGGASYGLLLFMLSAGLTLVFGLMGALFEHAVLRRIRARSAGMETQGYGVSIHRRLIKPTMT